MKIKKYTVLAACLLVFGTFNVSYADYMMGSHGNDVRILQRRLALYGLNVKANGTYDKATYKAVVKFQKKRHLTADGIIGPATYKALTGYSMKTASKAGSDAPAAVKKSSSAQIQSTGINDFLVQWHSSVITNSTVKAITEEAQKYIGVPYQFGGTTPKGFDCSGFIQYVFNRKGIVLPRSADEQYTSGRKISVNALEPGDLVFFKTYDQGISHSGLYLGDGYFISATSSKGVAVATMKSGYWHDRYVGANRVL